MTVRVLGVLAAIVFMAGACGSDGSDAASAGTEETSAEATAADDGVDSDGDHTEAGDQRYPDVIDVTVERTGDTYAFSVTISSPYDTPERYADGWRVMGADGTVYGEHTLMHDHAGEQPFTRTQGDVEIPADVEEVLVEGRDSEYGYGGDTKTVSVP